jgi:Mn2+/Fe2+ NRAMP family transporter
VPCGLPFDERGTAINRLTKGVHQDEEAPHIPHKEPATVLKGTFIPTFSLDSTFIATVVAILGTTISPYLFFWQTNEEVEEEISKGRKALWQRKGATKKELTYAGWDVGIGMFFSNLVMYFIILATAATLFTAGKHNIQTATQAAQALRPLAGNAASILLAVGLIGAGFLAVPILTGSAAYALSEALGWKFGFDKKIMKAKPFYAIIIVATIAAMLMNFIGINAIAALFWTAVINGVLAPPLIILLMLVTNNRKIMGKRINNAGLNIIGWLTAALMLIAAVALFITL